MKRREGAPQRRRRLRWAALGGSVLAIIAAGIGYRLWQDIQPQIYLGDLVPAGQLRAVVGLSYGVRQTSCTGTLIAEDMVLTAAHCVCGHSPTHVFLGENPLATGAAQGKFFPVAGWLPKGADCPASTANGLDLAVVRIRGSIVSTKPFPLAETAPPDTMRFLGVGYGATDRQGVVIDFRKRKGRMPMMSPSCSGPGEAGRYGCETGLEIVAGGPGGADTCRGDSGGPLLMPANGADVTVESKLVLAGVTSRGVKSLSKCGDGGIYEPMRPNARAWISNAIRELQEKL